MNNVEPIRDKDTISDIKRYLAVKSERNYILFFLGISVGIRISDLLTLKKKDVKNGEFKLKEKKTNKLKQTVIPTNCMKAVRLYIDQLDDEDFLFVSRKGINKPISRVQAWRIIKDLETRFKLPSLGTHTLRKTFGYHFYKQFNDVVTLQKIFNHKEPKETLIYIGIQQDEINVLMKKFNS
ncbi:site-specific integrase [Listeria monocytogenes]|nr:site-specific integrase [Listeria monocytogenes]